MGGVVETVGSALGLGGGEERARRAQVQPIDFTGGGFTGTFEDGGYSVRAGGERERLIGGIQDTLRGAARQYRDLRQGADAPLTQLRSAIEESNQAAIERIRDAERRSVGNLRQNLARRRVLGSSFGADAVSRRQAEFGRKLAQQEAEAGERLANTRLEELDLRTDLINRETTAEQQAFQTALDELNLEADIAQKLASRAQQQQNRNAKLRYDAAQQEAQGLGSLVGTIGGAVLGGPIGGSIGSALFGG